MLPCVTRTAPDVCVCVCEGGSMCVRTRARYEIKQTLYLERSWTLSQLNWIWATEASMLSLSQTSAWFFWDGVGWGGIRREQNWNHRKDRDVAVEIKHGFTPTPSLPFLHHHRRHLPCMKCGCTVPRGAGVRRAPIWAELGHAGPSRLQCLCDVASN